MEIQEKINTAKETFFRNSFLRSVLDGLVDEQGHLQDHPEWETPKSVEGAGLDAFQREYGRLVWSFTWKTEETEVLSECQFKLTDNLTFNFCEIQEDTRFVYVLLIVDWSHPNKPAARILRWTGNLPIGEYVDTTNFSTLVNRDFIA